MKRENFNLVKLTMKNNGNLIITDRKEVYDGDTKSRDEDTKKTDATPSPDMKKAMDALKPFLAECYGINFADEFLTAEGLDQDKIDAFKVVKPIIRREYKSVLNKITITSVSLSGSEETQGVVISGKMLQENGTSIAMNTPNIKLKQENFGFESELSDKLDDVVNEAWEFLYNGKKQQYEMFDEPKKDEEVLEEAPAA